MAEPDTSALPPIARQIWDLKYRLRDAGGRALEASPGETFRRVAAALALAEAPERRVAVAAEFEAAMADFAFLPAGRILAGAGAGRAVTLFNCFVMGTIPDSLEGIFSHLKEAALTLQQGGGIGYDFSSLRPKGARVAGVGADASGPVSFMEVWDAMCRTIMSAGARCGAMMACLSAAHPDIEAFIDAKAEAARLRNFNLSVLVSDAFMAAVERDEAWPLVFAGTTYKTLSARALWAKIMQATYTYAEPGVIFIDRINALNNLGYCETISATNPCGEQPLPPYGACLLGSINLARLVTAPFTAEAAIDQERLRALTRTAVRLLDNAIDVSRFPLPAQQAEAQAKRRIGLGVTGLADALILAGVRYGSPRSLALAQGWLAIIEDEAYRASADLAAEKGAFPLYDAARFMAAPKFARLGQARAAIRDMGLRNGLLTSIAPTGTISLFAGNVSGGIEPVFAARAERRVLLPDGSAETETVEDYAFALWRRTHGDIPPPAEVFVTAEHLAPDDHLAMQAAAQAHVDSAISKTINVPAEISFEAFKEVYRKAYALGCKGLTTFRPNAVTGAVLTPVPAEAARPPAPRPRGEVVFMTEPLERPETLAGATYKLRWPASDHALYITLNDVVQDGRRRPFEIFINSKNMEHYAWTVALTRMISAVFRRGGDVSFVVEELQAVFDPQGGHWIKGRYVPSLLAAIGDVIDQHLRAIGFLGEADRGLLPPEAMKRAAEIGEGGATAQATSPKRDAGPQARRARPCPRCGRAELVRVEGCDTCAACGYSKCG